MKMLQFCRELPVSRIVLTAAKSAGVNVGEMLIVRVSIFKENCDVFASSLRLRKFSVPVAMNRKLSMSVLAAIERVSPDSIIDSHAIPDRRAAYSMIRHKKSLIESLIVNIEPVCAKRNHGE